MLSPPRVIETARLTLRAPVIADSAVLFEAYMQDPEVTRYLTWQPHHDVGETEELVRRCEMAWNDGTAFPWVIVRREPGDLIGMVEVRLRQHKVDLGCVLARRHWRQGYMTEAVGAVVDWAFDQPTIHRVWATCDVENTGSVRLLERLGLQREGVLRSWISHPNVSADPRDSFCYARVRGAVQPAIAPHRHTEASST